jgi:hypothetical protein
MQTQNVTGISADVLYGWSCYCAGTGAGNMCCSHSCSSHSNVVCGRGLLTAANTCTHGYAERLGADLPWLCYCSSPDMSSMFSQPNTAPLVSWSLA